MDIFLFADGDDWVVSADGDTRRFAVRSEAFAAARGLARDHSPSRVVRERPAHTADDARGNTTRARTTPDLPGEPDISDFDEAELFGEVGTTRAAPHDRVDAPARGSGGGEAEQPPAPPRSWDELAGPDELGRSLLVPVGTAVPGPWRGAPVERVTTDRLGDPTFLGLVRDAFLTRTRVVYEVDPPDLLPTQGRILLDLWELTPDLDLVHDAAWHLLTVNSVDARDPDAAFWPPAGFAVAAGATFATDGPARGDVALPDGVPAWCDGGPLQAFAPDRPTPGTVVVPLLTIERGRLDPCRSVTATDDHTGLAPDQLAAVVDPRPRARIIAPAGSGKTRVLTERARSLVRDQRLPAAALCLVAFNKRAQLEMRERTRDVPGLQVQTLNALALSVLNGGGGFLARGATVRTIDEIQVRDLLGTLVKFPRRANTDPAAAWIDALSAVRLGLRDPRRVEAEFGGEVDGFAEVFPTYRAALADRGVVDFDDQIASAIEVLLRDPAAREQAQRNCRLLLVDEFQDLTPAHLLLLRLLAGPQLAVFGVGDDDQTIYGYSGASPGWLIDFDHYFPGADHLALEVNYRCPAPVVASAANLLSHNAARVPKEIRPGPDAATGADTLRRIAAHEPTEDTVGRVLELIQDGVAPRDIAVLSRVNTLLAPVAVALHDAGVGVSARDGSRFLDRTGVAAVLSWLRLAVEPDRLRGRDIQQAARRPGRSLSPRVLEWMAEQSTPDGLRRLAARLSEERDTTKVEGFVADLERIAARATTSDTASLVEFVRSDIGLDRAMQTLDAAHRGRNTAAHADDLRALIALGRIHPDPATLEPFLREALAAPRDEHGVTLATVHTVKGLEWPHVIVHDVSQGLFPHRLSTDVEEERRVFHVALTRGASSVTLVADRGAPSMFLDELDAVAETPPVAPAIVDTPMRATTGPADIAAAVGLELVWGGYECSITAVATDGVTLTSGRAGFTVAYGSAVTVDGRPRTLAAPTTRGPRPDTTSGDEDPAVVQALKQWRLERSRRDSVPAYVVMTDKTLNEIAARRPTDLDQLSGVSGIGPSKLERYGDEVLAIVEGARSG